MHLTEVARRIIACCLAPCLFITIWRVWVISELRSKHLAEKFGLVYCPYIPPQVIILNMLSLAVPVAHCRIAGARHPFLPRTRWDSREVKGKVEIDPLGPSFCLRWARVTENVLGKTLYLLEVLPTMQCRSGLALRNSFNMIVTFPPSLFLLLKDDDSPNWSSAVQGRLDSKHLENLLKYKFRGFRTRWQIPIYRVRDGTWENTSFLFF